MPSVCEVCGRQEGAMIDRCGEYDGIPIVLERCDLCKRLCCPDCLGEADCCFVDEDEHADDPHWSPPGWRIVKRDGHLTEWRRIDS